MTDYSRSRVPATPSATPVSPAPAPPPAQVSPARRGGQEADAGQCLLRLLKLKVSEQNKEERTKRDHEEEAGESYMRGEGLILN